MPGSDEILRSRLLFSYSFLRSYAASGEEASIAIELLQTIRDWQRSRKTDSPIDILESFLKPVLQTLELELCPRMDGNLDAFPVRPAWGDEKPIALLLVASSGDALDALEPGSGQWMVRAVNAARGYSDADLFDDPGLRWVILTNGTLWRLLDAHALRRYEAFIEFDVDTLARKAEEYPDLAHLFQRCFSREAFITDEDGQTELERLLQASEESTEEVERYLKISVSDDLEIPGDSDGILAQFCLGIVKATGQESFIEVERDAIYLDAIHLLYRLLFILYAEAWNLLPREKESYAQRSLSRILDKVEDDHRNGISIPSSISIWDQMKWLFDVLDVGDDDLGIPAYNGGLFRNEDKPYLKKLEMTDLYLSRALFLLGYMPKHSSSTGDHEYERIDYRDLSVRQLGSLYEGMIEYKLFIAEEEMYARRDERGDLSFLNASGATKKPTDQVISAGEIYFAQSPGERRATGTHYTPEEFVDKLVRRTLLPTVEERKKEILPKYNAWMEEIQISSDKKRVQLQGFVGGELTAFIEQSCLSLRIADISMGSGHFLVNVAHQLTNSIIEILSLPLWDLKDTELDPQYWRRQVVERCLYGVDIKPMAVELAKLSLWLISMSPGKPLTFLDHHLKVGDSIVGVSLEDLEAYASKSGLIPSKSIVKEAESTGQYLLATLEKSNPLIDAAKILRLISTGPSDSIGDAKDKDIDFDRYIDLISKYRLFADGICAKEFGAFISDNDLYEIGRNINTIDFIAPNETIIKEISKQDVKYFHWDLEFPDVFLFGPDGISLVGVEKGFNVILGNPPYLGGNRISSQLGKEYSKGLRSKYDHIGGSADLSVYFLRRGFDLLGEGESMGYVATNTIAQGDSRIGGLSRIINLGGRIEYAEKYLKWPGDASVEVNLISISNDAKEPKFSVELNKEIVGYISSRLDSAPEEEPFKLAENQRKSFQGSIVLGKGFILEPAEADVILKDSQTYEDVIFPYINGKDLNSSPTQSASRFVINFHDWPLVKAKEYDLCFSRIEKLVLPERRKVKRKKRRDYWWQFAEKAIGLYSAIAGLEKVLTRSVVSEIHSLAFINKDQVYDMTLVVFAFDDHYHFALLQSNIHEIWARMQASTLRTDIRYTQSTCFKTFPFPQTISDSQTTNISKTGETYYEHRQGCMMSRNLGLTKIYNLFNDPVCHDYDIIHLRDLHVQMDKSILDCYGWADIELDHDFRPNDREKIRFSISHSAKREILRRLIKLNHGIAKKELLENEPR